jgi:hypothetical protein
METLKQDTDIQERIPETFKKLEIIYRKNSITFG